jgi:hypothetical protein
MRFMIGLWLPRIKTIIACSALEGGASGSHQSIEITMQYDKNALAFSLRKAAPVEVSAALAPNRCSGCGC